MWTTAKRSVAAVTALALAATVIMPLQASAAPAAKPPQFKARDSATDFSSARRYRRGGNAAAAAMFGAVAGTIATIAINEQRRKRERDAWRYRYGYAGYPYAAPQAYYGNYYAPAPRVYHRGNPYMYGTPYHGPRGPWVPPCARGSTC